MSPLTGIPNILVVEDDAGDQEILRRVLERGPIRTRASFVSDGDISSIAALLLDKGTDGRISLSEAVQAANRTGNIGLPDKIVFDIPLNEPGHVYYQDDGGAHCHDPDVFPPLSHHLIEYGSGASLGAQVA